MRVLHCEERGIAAFVRESILLIEGFEHTIALNADTKREDKSAMNVAIISHASRNQLGDIKYDSQIDTHPDYLALQYLWVKLIEVFGYRDEDQLVADAQAIRANNTEAALFVSAALDFLESLSTSTSVAGKLLALIKEGIALCLSVTDVTQ